MAALAKSKERPLVLENCFAAPFLAACSTLSNLRRGSHKSAALLYSFKNSSRGSQFFRTHQGRLSWVAVHHHKRTRWRGMQPPLKTMGTNPWIHLEINVPWEKNFQLLNTFFVKTYQNEYWLMYFLAILYCWLGKGTPYTPLPIFPNCKFWCTFFIEAKTNPKIQSADFELRSELNYSTITTW